VNNNKSAIMKKLLLFSTIFILVSVVKAQNFDQYMATAKASYASNKLEDAHFALQQALSEVDLVTGKQVLALLPSQMGNLPVNTKDDNVFSNVGFVGATVHRTWGANQEASLDIISNSPLVSSLSAFLNTPLIGGLMNSDKSKTIKVQGYKGRLDNDGGGTNGTSNYTLQIPLNGALITFVVKNTSESDIMNYANTIPLGQIAKLIQ
jgi:hypothetical protein